MKIDDKALQAAFEILGTAIHKGETGKYPADDRRLCKRMIEAYEAARWRPIAEAPKQVQILIDSPREYLATGQIHGDLVCIDGADEVDHLQWYIDQKAMFRTIDPPTKP